MSIQMHQVTVKNDTRFAKLVPSQPVWKTPYMANVCTLTLSMFPQIENPSKAKTPELCESQYNHPSQWTVPESK
jgi:hypothetical protein